MQNISRGPGVVFARSRSLAEDICLAEPELRFRRGLAILACLLPIGIASLSAATAERPNVVIVMTDDQGYGDLSCHGNPVVRTPHLDDLHDGSVRFTDFHVAPMCTPTRGQLITGLDAFRNGAMNVSSGRTLLRLANPTMADFFRQAGYETGIFGKWHLGDNYPFRPEDRGFKEALWFPSSHIDSLPDFWNNDYFDDTYIHNTKRREYHGYCTDVFFGEAIKWIEQQARAGRPFLAYIPLNAAHAPHFVPDQYRPAVRERLEAALPSLPELSDEQKSTLVIFLAMIENIDDNMGRLESFLTTSGLRDNTLLIFLTDNGSTMGPRYYNAGMRGGKVTLWEGGHRVPLFVRWPKGGFGEPRDIPELTHVQDLLPTLIDLCGLPNPDKRSFDGLSLAGLLRGQQDSLPDRKLVVNYSRMPFGINRPTPNHPGLPRREGAAVLWRRWRLLEDTTLYDLDADPMQQHNIIEQHPEVAAAMRHHLDEWWDGVKDRVNEPSRVVVGSDAENPTMLSACEWFDVFVDQQRQVRQAALKNGIWYIQVAQAGQYHIELRRYPRESGLAMGQGIPPTPVRDGVYVAGRELPVAKARLSIGPFDKTVDLSPDARFASFDVSLDPGPVTMQTWLLDRDGNEICGAYYAYLHRE